MEVIIPTFFDAVAALDVLIASSNDIKRVETRTTRLRNNSYWQIFFFYLPPKIPRDVAFIPSILKRMPRWRES